jgi:hypothetical protein
MPVKFKRVQISSETFESASAFDLDNDGVIDIGSGCGIHFVLADLRGTGRLDIVAPGKDGLQVFFNEGI